MRDDLSNLNEEEKANLLNLYQSWVKARQDHDFPLADTYRKELVDSGVDLVFKTWHPVYESSSSRMSRSEARKKFKLGYVYAKGVK